MNKSNNIYERPRAVAQRQDIEMGMTITEKILAVHAGKERVEPGELINAKIDIAMGNDISIPLV